MSSFPAPTKKSQRWRAALDPRPVHAHSVDCDIRARSHSARARNIARLPELLTRVQFVEKFAMVRAPYEHSRGSLRDHYLSRRKCANITFIYYL